MTASPLSPSPSARGHAFLDLGERLRRRGQFAAAATVTLAGLTHYPELAAAHDLLGRIRADQHDDAAATAAWQAALECDPTHVGARKGLAYLAFRDGDYASAERHLDVAVTAAPHDPTVLAALDRVRSALPVAPEQPLRLDDPANAVLLFDKEGMRLVGGLGAGASEELADAVAAEAAGVAREAGRTSRLLDLGLWRQVIIEGSDTHTAILPVSADATLCVTRPATTPIGRLVATAQRAAQSSRTWLGRVS